MQIIGQVLQESCQTRDGVEYVTVACMEQGDHPLLQVWDYTLRRDELSNKGLLVGRSVTVRVETIRSIFSGRPQFQGRILEVH